MKLAVTLIFSVAWIGCRSFQLECQRESGWSYQYDSSSCVLENVHQRNFADLQEDVFQNSSMVELANATFTQFGSSHFQQLPTNVTHLVFSYGDVSEVSFMSDSLKSLRIFEANTTRFFIAERPNHVLKKLTIRSRLLNELPKNLGYVFNLTVLSLSGCNLTTVEMKSLENSTHLTHLDLSDNRIASIEVDPILLLPRLKVLYIHANELREIERFPEAFPRLWTVSLIGNGWYCDWVTAARGRILDAWIVVEGSETDCIKRFNNGGLCCDDRTVEATNERVPEEKLSDYFANLIGLKSHSSQN